MTTDMTRRAALALLLNAAALGSVRAQSSTGNPIKWLVGYPAGAASDYVSRMIAAQLATRMSRNIIVENKPGAGGSIAAAALAQSAPDGETVMYVDNGILIFNTALFKKPLYDADRDMKSVGVFSKTPFLLLANPASKYATVQQVVDAFRKDPGNINYASPGIATPHNLAMEMFKDKAKLVANPIHYKGGAPAIQDVIGGQLDLIVLDAVSATPLLKGGKLKPLAVFSKQRLALAPDAPSLIELGYTDVEVSAWGGLVVPGATPDPVRNVLADALKGLMATEAMRTKITEVGAEPQPAGAAEMDELRRTESRYWIPLIRSRGITVD